MTPKVLSQPHAWLKTASLRRLFDALEVGGEETRINGGAVRNAIMGEPIRDIDLATTLLPEQVVVQLEKHGIKAVPTGLEHGTITAVVDSTGYEITTLRSDVETDGRHAQVVFGRNWEVDAARRDFTMNALYCDCEGKLFDPLGGYDDAVNRNIRFIGDPSARIEEDYLRILRFFRFFAIYGQGRPDADGLKACTRLKDGVDNLSAERVWKELKLMLGAPNPSRALLWMRTTGVLTKVLPENEQWGIDFFADLMRAEAEFSWPGDAMLRLMCVLPPITEKLESLGKRLRFSNSEKQRLSNWDESVLPKADCDEAELQKLLYLASPQGVEDRIRLEIVRLMHVGNAEELLQRQTMLASVEIYVRPKFPVSGKDLAALGIEPGKAMGDQLKALEQAWVESDFQLTKDELLKSI